MGLFMSLNAVPGKPVSRVLDGLARFASVKGGGLRTDVAEPVSKDNRCVIVEENGNTTILFPSYFQDWENSAAYLSKELGAPVFALHIHDGSFWMYVLYYKGEVIDQFNPLPEYWEEVSEEEMNQWKGDAAIVARFVPGLLPADIEKYLTHWNIDDEQRDYLAYPDDDYVQEEWQLLDFMRKTGLPYPLDDLGEPLGKIFELWTKDNPLKIIKKNLNYEIKPKEKPTEAPPPPEKIVFQAPKPTIKKPWWKLW